MNVDEGDAGVANLVWITMDIPNSHMTSVTFVSQIVSAGQRWIHTVEAIPRSGLEEGQKVAAWFDWLCFGDMDEIFQFVMKNPGAQNTDSKPHTSESVWNLRRTCSTLTEINAPFLLNTKAHLEIRAKKHKQRKCDS